MGGAALVVACLLAASNASEVTLAAPLWSAANVKPEVVQFWTGHLAQQVSRHGPHVITQDEIAALIGIERQRELMGCSDGSSCLAELANALGSDGLIIGSVAHLGDQFQINLKIIASKDGRTLSQFSTRVSSEVEVADELTRAAAELTPTMLEALGVKVKPAGSGISRRWWAAVPAVLGVAALVAGGGAASGAKDASNQLRDPATTLDYKAAQKLYQDGLDKEHLGIAGFVAGGVLIAGAAVLFFLLDEPPAVSFEVRSHGFAIALDGVHW